MANKSETTPVVVGRTAWDFVSEAIKSRTAMLIATAIFIVLPLTVHYLAEPASEVNLFGLIKYTKSASPAEVKKDLWGDTEGGMKLCMLTVPGQFTTITVVPKPTTANDCKRLALSIGSGVTTVRIGCMSFNDEKRLSENIFGGPMAVKLNAQPNLPVPNCGWS